MDFALQWLLIGLPIAFGLGWLASRFDLRQWKRDSRDNPRAVFKGLNLLLNEQQDKAIDAFIEAVQNDPDTAELHFALGNLFRRRGEFERAVRVHEHLLRRPDLKEPDRHRAQRALAQDYVKAGLFDRAEAAWLALADTSYATEALLALLSLYERSRDWPRALQVARQLHDAGEGAFEDRIAHYECEQALEADAQGRSGDAEAALARARSAAPRAARALLLSGERAAAAGRTDDALSAWDLLREAHPAAFLLVAEAYARNARDTRDGGRAEAAREMLHTLYRQLPAIELLQALQQLDAPDSSASLARLRGHLQRHPSLAAAQMLLAQPPAAWHDDGLAALRGAVAQAARPLNRYRCAACGFEAQRYFWQCPGCLSWDSYPPVRQEGMDAL